MFFFRFQKSLARFFLLSMSLASLVACSTFSKKECESIDYKALGYKDGQAGDDPDRSLAFYREKCQQEHGVPVNETLFRESYTEGLKVYCTPERQRELGLGGHYFKQQLCPSDKSMALASNNKEGRYSFLESQYALLTQKVRDLERANSSQANQINYLRRENEDLRKRCK